ncbi:hypothetical protein HZS_4087 [Henneguya salminicola]|nr:hypothetical protein HZS_4087 [Henneguya salminicola]
MWRIVPGTSFKPTWAISEVKFYKKHHLEDIELEISSVFSSSQYDGYETHFAFDNNSDTFWMPESWGNHDPGSEWIGANLSEKEKVHAVQLKIKDIDGAELPKYIHIESSNSQYESFIRRWTYHINKDEPNKVYYKPGKK